MKDDIEMREKSVVWDTTVETIKQERYVLHRNEDGSCWAVGKDWEDDFINGKAPMIKLYKYEHYWKDI